MNKTEDHRKGHRARLKGKYYETGESALHDYELLEMLLFYSIPRRETKSLAKELIHYFGSLDNLLNADVQQIKNAVSGVGEETAILIKLTADLCKRAHNTRGKEEPITGVKQAAEHFKNLLENEASEKFAVMILDNGNRIQFLGVISDGTVSAAEVDLMKLTKLIAIHQASGIILGHNHPKGLAQVSGADVSTTLMIRDFINQLGVVLLDHIIIGENGAYSMRSDLEFNRYFDTDSNKRRY